LRRGDTGDEVAHLQRLVGAEVDGDFGPATEQLVMMRQMALGLEPDGVVGPLTWRALLDGVEPLPNGWIDRTELHASQFGPHRPYSKITGITLHQTATCFLRLGAPPTKRARAIERVGALRAHFVGLRDGTVVQATPLDRVAYHAQAVFNRSDVGIEIDGYYAGVEGDDSTFWRPSSKPNRQPMAVSQVQIDAMRDLCAWVCAEVKARGGEVRYVHAHRQTHWGKPSDPGELLWREVGVWCQDALGLSDGGDGWRVTSGTGKAPGRAIPRAWDPRRTADYR